MLSFGGVMHLGRTQQRQIAHVGQRADVQHIIVGQRITVPEPHLLLRSLAGQAASASWGTIRTSHSANCLNPASSNALMSDRPGRSSGGGAVGIASWCSMPLWSV